MGPVTGAGPVVEGPWRPGWAVLVTVVCLAALVLLAAGFVPDLARNVRLMQDHGQDLGTTVGVFGGVVGITLVLGSAVPGVWFLFAGGRPVFWAGVVLAVLWVGAVLALLGDDLPAVIRELFR